MRWPPSASWPKARNRGNKVDASQQFSETPLRILDERLHADPSRVVLRPFHLGWQATTADGSRARKLIDDIAGLSDD